ERDVAEGDDPRAAREQLEADDHDRVDAEQQHQLRVRVVLVGPERERRHQPDDEQGGQDRVQEPDWAGRAVAPEARDDHWLATAREPAIPRGRTSRMAITIAKTMAGW